MEKVNIKEIIGKIDIHKEILSNMPVNTKKNKERYVEEVNKIEEIYKLYEKEILTELSNRFKEKMSDITQNTSYEKLERRMSDLQEIYRYLNEMNTSYEKMQIDRIIYRIRKFYKENLDNINYEILKYIELFKNVDIVLDIQDFQYSQYTNEYMQVFFKEKEHIKNGEYSMNLKDTFDEIYWKCPDIIVHIELNLRYIYLKYESKINKFYAKVRNQILQDGIKKEDVRREINNLKQEIYEEKNHDKYTIINKFFNGELKIGDYEENKIKSEYEKIIDVDMSEVSIQKQKEINDNISKFLENLYEYKSYLKFKFILDDIKEIYKQKENYKNIYNTNIKEIENLEKNFQKISKTMDKKAVFRGKSTSERNIVKYNELINDIRESYKKLDTNKIYNKVYEKINNESTIYDVFEFANSFNGYVRDTIIKYFPTIETEELEEKVVELDEFVNYQNIKIINNINILEDKDIALIIKDRYSLLNFNISKTDLDEDNIETLTTLLKKLKRALDIKKSGLTINEIEEICNIRDLLKREKFI